MIISGRSYLLNQVSGKFIELPSNQIVLGDRNVLFAETGIAIGKFNFNSGIIPTGIDDFFAPSVAFGYANDIRNVKENFSLGFGNISSDGNNKYIIGRINSLSSGDNIYLFGTNNSLDYSTLVEVFGSDNFVVNSNNNYVLGDNHFISGGQTIINIGNNNTSQNNQSINLIGLTNIDRNGSANNLLGLNNVSENNSNANLIGNSNSVSNSNTNLLIGSSNFSNSGDLSLLVGFNNSLLSSTSSYNFVSIQNAVLSYLNTSYYPIDDSTGTLAVYSTDPLNPFEASTIYNDGSMWAVYGEYDGQNIYYSLDQFYNPWEVTDWNFYDPAWSPAPIQGDITYNTQSIIDGNVGNINTLIGNTNISINSSSSLVLGNNNITSDINNIILGNSNSNIYSGFNNFIVGNFNNLDYQYGTANFIVGFSNYNKNSNSSYIGGNTNTILNGSSSVLLGNSNLISGLSGSSNFLNLGTANTLQGNGHLSIGNNNLINGNNNSIFGTFNTISTGAQSCIIIGRNQTLTGLNEVGKIRLGTSSSTNLSIKLDKVEITSLLDPTINDQKIITSAHTGELVSSNKLASYEYLSLSGQSFGRLDFVDNEMDHLPPGINIINGNVTLLDTGYYYPNYPFSGIKNARIFTSSTNFYKIPRSIFNGPYSVDNNYLYENRENQLYIYYTTSLNPARWIIGSTGTAYFYENTINSSNDLPISDWDGVAFDANNFGGSIPTFTAGIVEPNINQKYSLINNFSANFNNAYISSLSNYYLSDDGYFSMIFGNNPASTLFKRQDGSYLNSQWMIVNTTQSGLYYFIDETGSNSTIVPYTGFVSTGQKLQLTGIGNFPNPTLTLQMGSRTGIIGSFHPDFGRIYVPFYY